MFPLKLKSFTNWRRKILTRESDKMEHEVGTLYYVCRSDIDIGFKMPNAYSNLQFDTIRV